MNLEPSEVWWADLGLAAKTRPVIIVSRKNPNPPRALVICVPITTQNRGSAYEIELPRLSFLRQGSTANVQGIQAVPIARLEEKGGKLPEEVLLKIKAAILFALDVEGTLLE